MQPFTYKRATDFPLVDGAASGRQGNFLDGLYEEDFDAPPAPPPKPQEPLPEPAPPDPVYGRADLDAAREEGRAEGRTETERGLAAARARVLTDIVHELTAAQALVSSVAAEAAETVARTMLSMLSACLPALCAEHGAGEISAIVRTLLPSLTPDLHVALRVSSLMVPAATEALATFDDDMARRVVVVPVDHMPPGDVRVSWEDGAAVREASRIRAAVNDALATLGLLEPEKIDA